jgi:hypothetical protein
MIGSSLCSMVARLSVIFGDGMKNFLDGDLLAATLRFNREIDVFVPPMARQNLFVCHPPRPSLFQSGVRARSIASTSAAGPELYPLTSTSSAACGPGKINLQEIT